MTPQSRFPLGLALACSVLGSCEAVLAPGPGSVLRAVQVEIPALPPAWSPLGDIDLALSWRDEQGRLREEAVRPGDRRLLLLPRGGIRALLVEARYRGRSLRPAGVLYPVGLGEAAGPGLLPHLAPTWAGGWTARVARLLEEGPGGEGVDFRRLEAESLERLSDPWDLEPSEAARRLAAGEWRSSCLALPPPLAAQLPGPGPWVSDSPFAEPPRPAGQAFEAAIRPGLRHFFSPDLELFIACAGDGVAVILVRSLH